MAELKSKLRADTMAPRLGTRLLFPLLVVVTLLMALYGMWSIRQRTRALVAEAERETQAYATALGIALEYALAAGRAQDLDDIIARIADEPRIYGVLVYGADAHVQTVAAPLSPSDSLASGVVQHVLSTERPLMIDRVVNGEEVYAVVRPIRGADGRSAGVLEVVQPLSFVRAETWATQRRLAAITLLLLTIVAALLLVLVRRMIGRPLGHFVGAARALGGGELAFRLDENRGARELSELAHAFNRMAAQLEAARDRATIEAEERVQLERRLRESEKLATVGNLAATLAHEIAAPLNVVSGRARVLNRPGTTEAARERNVRIIGDQIDRITLIVRNLLDFARRREPRIEPIDVGRIADTVVEFLEDEFARVNVQVVREGAGSVWVHGDGDLLQQVFVNLLVNALHALQAGIENATVVVRVRPPDSAGSVAIDIEDNGPGIPEDVLPQLFEPFVTTKRDRAGTGLGLAVARSIVTELGGSLDAWNRGSPRESRSDAALGRYPLENGATARGAVFRVILPAAPAPGVQHG